MEVQSACCCGLDGPKQTVVACLLRAGAGGQHRRARRSFATMTDDRLALADWLRAAGCPQVARERTGVYWKLVDQHP